MSDEKNKERKKSLLNDHDGKPSSKRIAGFIILFVGLALHMATCVTSFFKVIPDPSTALAVGNTLLICGSSLLGIGTLENFKQK